jgi:hypothetical protein
MLFKAVRRMKAGISAAYSVFIIVLTTVSVITLLYFFVTSTSSSPTVPEWLAVIGIIIMIYVMGTAASLAGLHAIEKLFELHKNRAIRSQREQGQ